MSSLRLCLKIRTIFFGFFVENNFINNANCFKETELTFELIERFRHLLALEHTNVSDAERLPLHLAHILHEVVAEIRDACKVDQARLTTVTEANLFTTTTSHRLLVVTIHTINTAKVVPVV